MKEQVKKKRQTKTVKKVLKYIEKYKIVAIVFLLMRYLTLLCIIITVHSIYLSRSFALSF